MFWEQQVQYACQTDVGFRRQNNQDACVALVRSERDVWEQHGHLFLVADGMGGHAVGELASKLAADTVPHAYQKQRGHSVTDAIRSATEEANRVIHERGTRNREFLRMGTTCSTLVLTADGAVIGHVGDSRVYRVRDHHIDQLSCDHSLLWELMKHRKLRPEELIHAPRNVITRSLGPDATVQVDVEGPFPILPGDVYVLCSDGLTGHVSDSEIGMVASELPPAEACRLLVNLANLRGGSDNITVVVARVGPLPDGVEVQVPPRPVQDGGVTWQGLLAGWALGAVFVLGAFLALLAQRPILGFALVSFSITAALIFASFWSARKLRERRYADNDRTVFWRPYRTAPARLNKEFLDRLAQIEAELQLAAREEDWPIDWERHEHFYQQTVAAAHVPRGRALHAFACIFDMLMASVQTQRRQMQHELRWGKGSQASGAPAES